MQTELGMDILTIGAAFLAGLLTVLNPCVLPILPIVFGSAANEHRYGPMALAAGLAISFTAVGLFVATIGFSIGLDADVFRTASGAMLVALGVVMTVPVAQHAFQSAMQPLGDWAAQHTADLPSHGWLGQFGLGTLLGAVWSPCVGPTLGAASILASQGKDLGMVTLAMGLFGIGASLPLMLIGTVGRQTLVKMRGRIGGASVFGKRLLGAGLVVAGLLVLSGLDKQLEALALQYSPQWLTDLTTSI